MPRALLCQSCFLIHIHATSLKSLGLTYATYATQDIIDRLFHAGYEILTGLNPYAACQNTWQEGAKVYS